MQGASTLEEVKHMFNPIKSVTTMITTTVTVVLLSYTHMQAFRMGLDIGQNPLVHKTAEVLGWVSPPAPCPTPEQESDDGGGWDGIP